MNPSVSKILFLAIDTRLYSSGEQNAQFYLTDRVNPTRRRLHEFDIVITVDRPSIAGQLSQIPQTTTARKFDRNSRMWIRQRAIVRDTSIENIRYLLHVLAALFLASFVSDVSLHLAVGEGNFDPYSAVETFFVTALTINVFRSDLLDNYRITVNREVLFRCALVCLILVQRIYYKLRNKTSFIVINGALLTTIFNESPPVLDSCYKILSLVTFVDLILSTRVAGNAIGFVSGVLCFYIFPVIDLKSGSDGEETISSGINDAIFLVIFSMIGRLYSLLTLIIMIPVGHKKLIDTNTSVYSGLTLVFCYSVTFISIAVYVWIRKSMRNLTRDEMESVLPAIKLVAKAAALVIAPTAVRFLVGFADFLLFLFFPSGLGDGVRPW